MKKVKLGDKYEKYNDSFFGVENSDENTALNSFQSAKISKSREDFSPENKSFINILKQLFLFLPGTFLLFFMSFGVGIIFMEIAVFRRPFEDLPDDYLFQFGLMGFIIFLGSLMTWLGLGDIKSRKHFVIPASLIITGAIFGALVKATASWLDLADKLLDDFGYMIFLFPLALIIPVLAKGFVDRKSAEPNDKNIL